MVANIVLPEYQSE